MATSSILKDFYVRDISAFEDLKKQIEKVDNTTINKERVKMSEPYTLREGREKLSTFKFRE